MRWLLLSTVVPVMALGCRNNAQLDAHLELMNAERRALEDELYELEYDYEKVLKKLKRTERDNVKLREQLEDSSNGFLEFPEDSEGLTSPPVVDPGIEAEPAPSRGSGTRKRRDQEPLRQRVSLQQRGGGRVSQLHINPTLTRLSNFDDQPGADGLTVVIEPRDGSGNFVAQAGAVSIVLLDYAQRGEAARVARWDVEASQVKKLLLEAEQRRGIYLELPWPGGPPEKGRVRLDVRFTTAAGRQFDARQDLDLSVNPHEDSPSATKTAAQGRQPGGWTPRAGNQSQQAADAVPRGEQSVGQLEGPPWTLEKAAGDALRRDRPAKQQAERPAWRPYR